VANALNSLGIDFGTSGARATVIDQSEEVIAESQTAYDILSPESWREALMDLVARLPLKIRSSLGEIAMDGTSSTCLSCDAENTPLLPPLLYNHSLESSKLPELKAIVPKEHIAGSPTSSFAKLLQYSSQPEFSKAAYFCHQADWLVSQLTGMPGVTDYHNALKLGYDTEAMRYPDWLASLPFAHLLPRVVSPGASLGPIHRNIARQLSLPPACRVHAGTTDSIAAFIASGANCPGDAVTSLGSTLVLKLLSTTRVEAPEYGVYSHKFGNLWLAGGASNSGGAVLRKYFTDEEMRRLSPQMDPQQSTGLDYYPLLKPGERFPINDPSLEPRLQPVPENKALFLKGLFESIAKIEANGYRLLEEMGATPLKCVFSAGGGAKNEVWTKIRANCMKVPLLPSIHIDASFGAARLAAKGEPLLGTMC
jgi:sugar (pentulose or hexulose) kinase